MKIELISKEQYEFLRSIYNKHPILTLQNNGYEYIPKSKLTEDDKQAIKKIEAILKEHIIGFSKFFNFRLSKKSNELQIRFDYDYGAAGNSSPFTGVGYMLLEELLNGFKEK